MKTMTKRILLIMTTACLMAFIATPARAATEEWVRRYSLLTGSHDTAKKVVADTSGNVIVAGQTTDDMGGPSLLIIKYSAAGVPLWTNRNDEWGIAGQVGLAVDGNGDVIVTAALYGTNAFHYATIKYSGDGVPLWTNRYNGFDGADIPTAVAVDGSGSVFVTGYSYTGSSVFDRADYATIKYSAAGVPLWTNRYGGPFFEDDIASALAVDNSGDVIVTGRSETDGFSNVDFATVKYSGAGVPLWTNRYNGGGDTSLDYMVTEVAVDGSGNSLVAGESFDGVSTDYATIKYSPSGVPLWTNRYHGPGGYSTPGAIAADGSGNVFVTGASADELFAIDYATVAYSGAGVPLWTNLYNGPGNDLDRARAIAVDESGNVFVTGFSYTGGGISDHADCATIKYSNSGVPLWTNRYNGLANGFDVGNSIAVDGNGNVFVAGDTADGTGGMGEADFLIIAYSGSGASLWTNRYNKLLMRNDDSTPTAMALDGSGNVLVTGSSDAGPGFNANYATVKYSSTGVLLWANWYNGPGDGEDRATGVAVDSNGNVYVTGRSVGSNIFEYATIKYSEAGMPLWTNRYSTESGNSSFAAAIAVDSDSNAYVTGSSYGSGGESYATVKYSTDGVPLWTNLYSNASAATAIAVDGNDDVVVTGYSYSTGYPEFATIKYSDAGVPLWTNRYGGAEPESGPDVAYAIAVDANDNVFVTGYSAYTNAGPDYTIVAYSGAGVPLWTNRYSGPGASIDEVHAIAVAANGNVFVTGASSTDVVSSSADYATVAYSGAGVPLWTNRYNGTANDSDSANAVTADGSGNVYVTGSSDGDYVTIKYSGAGVPLWTNRYNGTGNGFDNAVAVAVDDSGSVFVTGSSWDGLNFDFATIKYSSAALLPIPLHYQFVGNQLVLSWTNAAFGLQAAPAVEGVYTNIPGATSPYTNALSDLQRYFRLKAN